MNFGLIQPGFLWALGALAIPVFVHLVFKRKSRKVDLGTLRFLKSVLQANSRTRNLKRWTLLAMRLGCICLLALLFARPHLQGFQTHAARPFLAILIDQSASMERKGPSGRLIDQAVAEARRLLENAGNGIDARVAFFDHAIHPLQAEQRSENEAKSQLDLLKSPPSLVGATNFNRAMEWARDVCVKSRQAESQVVVLTDLQRAGLDWTLTESFPSEIKVRVVDLGQPQTSNAAVASVNTLGPVSRPGKSAVVTATILNSSPFALEKVDTVLHLTRGDRQINLRQQVSLAPGSTGQVTFETPELAEGLWRGYVELDHDDDFPFDNKRWLAVRVAPPLATLIVDGQPNRIPQRSSAYFLETALRLAPPGEVAPERLFDPTLMAREDGTKWPDLKSFSLVVLANVPEVTPAEASRLAKWVQAGGGLLIFAGEPTTEEGTRALVDVGLGVGNVRGFATSNTAPWRLEEWDARHPVFEPFGDVQRGELSRRAFRGVTRIDPAADAVVLARFSGGTPAVIQKDVGQGHVIWVAAGCDGNWSDWPRSRLYLPLNYQLLSDLGGLSQGGPVRNHVLDDENDGTHLPGVEDAGNHWNVWNISPRESETDHATVEDFAQRFGFSVESDSIADGNTSRTAGFDLRQDEIWPMVLLLLLGLFLAEGFLGNRTVG